MSEIEILVFGRAIERVLIVLICGASLGFGWNLFREGVVKDQEAALSRGQWKLTFKKVGPGVFFALFACIGLVYAVTSPLTLGPRTAAKGELTALAAATITASYDAPTVDKLARDEIRAINTLTILWQSDRLPNAPKAELQAGDQSAKMLLERKDRLLQAIFPQEYERYKDIKSIVVTHGGRICLGNKKVNLSTVFAGQAVGIKEVNDDIWLVSFMDYDLGYFDLETRMLEPIDNPFGPRLSPI